MMFTRVAGVIALLFGALAVVSVVLGQLAVIPIAVFLLAAGAGILRGRVWAGFGLAAYFFVQPLVVSLRVFGPGGPALTGAVIAAMVGSIFAACFFLVAGLTLRRSGAVGGGALPWLAFPAAVLLVFLVYEPYVMPSASMENTLLIGDRMLVRRFPKLQGNRGDIVVFLYPLNHREACVKRIVGIPGDHIKIVNKVVYRNGSALEEPYVRHLTNFVDSYRDNFPSATNQPLPAQATQMLDQAQNGEVIVPPRHYFVLGDNRDDSSDSRYWGFVADTDIIGKPVLIYQSEEKKFDPINGEDLLHPGRIRWNRLFKIL